MKERLLPEVFCIPVEKIKSGFYSDKYFTRTRDILHKDNNHSSVMMQVFSRGDGIICGMDEAVAILRSCAENPDQLKIHALYDGDSMSKGETVLTIEGDYSTFAHLETLYLGVLARGSSVASAVNEAVRAARGKYVLFFAARFDHYRTQLIDGYAAFIGGAHGVSTDANGCVQGVPGIGTIPHSLIAAYRGDTLAACRAFDMHTDAEVDLIALVDFNNDCVKTSLEVARYFKKKLWGVRLDTAGDMRDISVRTTGKYSFGVCPQLVRNVRKALDREGFSWVKIVVSGGFTEEKIEKFVTENVPFDAVGIGSSLFKKKIDFTADIVQLEGKPCAKKGRKYKPNSRLAGV